MAYPVEPSGAPGAAPVRLTSGGMNLLVAASCSCYIGNVFPPPRTPVVTSSAPPVRGHLPSLDGVRGLAILMVICSHAFYSNSEASGGVARRIGDLLGYGFFGVDLFFVLSGFLITGILVDSVEEEGFFRKFYARRALRIFPLYYGVLLVLFLLTPALHLAWKGMGWLLVTYLQNLRPGQIVEFTPGAGLLLNHFWSLAIEEQFYLVWPAVVFLVRDRRRLLWTTLAVSGGALVLRLALVGAGVDAAVIHVTTITRADSLLLGGTLALLFRSAAWSRVLRWAPLGLVVSVAAVGVSIALLPRELGHASTRLGVRLWVDGARYTVLAAGSACLIACALRPASLADRVFSSGWLRFFGRYSYGIYVLHMVPLGLLIRAQRPWIAQATGSKMLAVAGAGVSSLALAVGAAYVSFHLYERPFLRLKRYFAYEPKRIALVPARAANARPMAADLVDSESYTSRVFHR